MCVNKEQWMNVCMYMYVCMYVITHGCTYNKRKYVSMHECIPVCMNEWMNEWIYVWCKFPNMYDVSMVVCM